MRPRHLLAQLLHPVAQVGGFFEVQLFGRLLHLCLELIDQLRQRLQRQAGIGIALQGLSGLADHLHQIRVRAVLLQLAAQLQEAEDRVCLLYTSPSPRDRQKSRMPSSA